MRARVVGQTAGLGVREGRGWRASDSGAPGPGHGRCEPTQRRTGVHISVAFRADEGFVSERPR
jgi:hypothetical protein